MEKGQWIRMIIYIKLETTNKIKKNEKYLDGMENFRNFQEE